MTSLEVPSKSKESSVAMTPEASGDGRIFEPFNSHVHPSARDTMKRLKNAGDEERHDSIVFHELKMDISVRRGGRMYYYTDVLYVVYEKPYCVIYCKDEKKCLVYMPLGTMQSNLPGMFFRCNRSVIVNLCKIARYDYGKKPEITMENGQKFALAHRRKAEFKKHKTGITRITVPHVDD
ncbi:MAG: LytTR family transcriptional regulator [Bacteroidales bacterium]|nr:LytTR family transcriptional regulator [Bacteroidales bacterium]